MEWILQPKVLSLEDLKASDGAIAVFGYAGDLFEELLPMLIVEGCSRPLESSFGQLYFTFCVRV